jgi:hypothetical protein
MLYFKGLRRRLIRLWYARNTGSMPVLLVWALARRVFDVWEKVDLSKSWLIDWFSHRIHNRRQAIIKRSVHIIQQSCICHYAVPAYRDKREWLIDWLIDWFSHRIHNRCEAVIKRSGRINSTVQHVPQCSATGVSTECRPSTVRLTPERLPCLVRAL